MTLWLVLAWAATLAGLVGGVAQIARPAGRDLVPLCLGSAAALLLAGIGHAVGEVSLLASVAADAGGPDRATARLTGNIVLNHLGHDLVLTGVTFGVVAVLAAIAWARTAQAARSAAPTSEAAAPDAARPRP